ncbi:MAG: OadG family protein [Lachnospiraceae bacterium]|nr:OadG family protein [Lachnospiraceae bacterium]
MITCMIGLCACGQEEAETLSPLEQSLLELGEGTITDMDQIVADGTMEQYAGNPAVYNGFAGWKDALTDIGKLEGTNGGTVELNEEEMVATINVNVIGTDHNATVEIVFDYSTSMGSFESITTNVIYSTGEIMLKAGMNTLIGMGTVFVVLILISLIISCFSLISKVEAKKKQKADAKAAAAKNEVKSEPVVTPIVEKEELADDTELVAVIAAAIAAYEGSGSTDGFIVRSIRKSNKSKWQNA